ncbi:MAG: hypothetical protein OHK0013_18720 [Sandaracinaceae bacterium]
MEFGGSLYVFYRGVGGGAQPISFLRRTGGVWYGPFSTGGSSDSGPAAALVGDRLYVVYRRGTGVSNLYCCYQMLPVGSAFRTVRFEGSDDLAGPRLFLDAVLEDGTTVQGSLQTMWCAIVGP